MGSRIANLQKNGCSLVVFNRTRAKAEPLLGPCGTFADSPAKLAQQVNVLFTMLADPEAVEQAALGDNGFLDRLPPDALWVDCSSVNPSFSKKMAAEAARRKIHFVDAPVTGSALGRRKQNSLSGSAPILPIFRRFVRCYSAWGTRLFRRRKGTGNFHENGNQPLIRNAMTAFAEAWPWAKGSAISQSIVRFVAWHARGRAVSGWRNGPRSTIAITTPSFRCAGCRRICISRR